MLVETWTTRCLQNRYVCGRPRNTINERQPQHYAEEGSPGPPRGPTRCSLATPTTTQPTKRQTSRRAPLTQDEQRGEHHNPRGCQHQQPRRPHRARSHAPHQHGPRRLQFGTQIRRRCRGACGDQAGRGCCNHRTVRSNNLRRCWKALEGEATKSAFRRSVGGCGKHTIWWLRVKTSVL